MRWGGKRWEAECGYDEGEGKGREGCNGRGSWLAGGRAWMKRGDGRRRERMDGGNEIEDKEVKECTEMMKRGMSMVSRAGMGKIGRIVNNKKKNLSVRGRKKLTGRDKVVITLAPQTRFSWDHRNKVQ